MVFGFGKKTPVEAQEVASSSPASTERPVDEKGSLEKEPVDVVASATGADLPDSVRRMSVVEAQQESRFLRRLHQWDPNLSSDVRDDLARATHDQDTTAELELINLIENDSPYPEVRAAVRNYDEEMPTNTIRAWTIGLFVVTVGSALNMLFSLRQPSIAITSFVAQLVSYPLGRGWDLIMPRRRFRTFGIEWSLNPSPFNQKEHTLITIMANVTFSGGPAYSTDTIVAMKGFYGIDFGWGFQLILTLGTQLIGFGLAGLLRPFLVYPAAMIWPSNFVNTSLFYALHDPSTETDPAKANGWSIGRYRYFLYVFLGAFVWYWFPGGLRIPPPPLFLFSLLLSLLALAPGTWIDWLMTVDRLDFPGAFLLLFRLLDCAKQCGCQSALRLRVWPRPDSHHL
jgi:hypothetical protein